MHSLDKKEARLEKELLDIDFKLKDETSARQLSSLVEEERLLEAQVKAEEERLHRLEAKLSNERKDLKKLIESDYDSEDEFYD